MSIELKIKSKHLGLEAQVIRHEENKLKNEIRWQSARGTADSKIVSQYQSIHNHRVWDVRNENRATFLARAYLAGKPYKSVEQKIRDLAVLNYYIVPRIFEMVNKYGPVENRIYKYWINDSKRQDYKLEEYKEKLQLIKDWMSK